MTLLSNSLRQIVHSHRASVHQVVKLVAALIRVARVTAGLVDSNSSQVYDSSHLQADCQEPGSAPEPYARQSSMGYLCLFLLFGVLDGRSEEEKEKEQKQAEICSCRGERRCIEYNVDSKRRHRLCGSYPRCDRTN